MNSIINFIFSHAPYAHYLAFGALLLAGLNVPISEDLIIIIGGILASTIIPQNVFKIFIWIFLGAYISDWFSYGIGRFLGPKLWKFAWFKKTISKKKIIKTQNYYRKHGFKTLLFGRFIPFGVRNCLFLTAGMARMRFLKFLVADGIACLISNSVLFSITYVLGKNYETVYKYLKAVKFSIFVIFLITIFIIIKIYKNRKRERTISR